MADGSSHSAGYERSDVSASLLAVLAGGVAVFLAATPFMLAGLLPLAAHQGSVTPPQTTPPHLQTDPATDLATLRRNEAARLSQYAWISRSPDVVRLPIDRALALTVERGLPGWQKP
jgi:hypothetical protein